MLVSGFGPQLLFGESEVPAAATHLVGLPGITQQEGGTVTHVHILFDAHQIVCAEGAASESFHPGAM